MTEQTSPEPAEGTVSPAGTNDGTWEVVPDDSDVPVYAEPQPVSAGVHSTVTEPTDPVEPADGDHPDFLVEDLRDTDDEPADVPAPAQTPEPDVDENDEEETD